MATMRVGEIRGMSPEMATKLRDMGIRDTDQLLERAGTAAQRRQLAKELGCEPSQLLEYVNRADLARLPGIGVQFSNLLEEAGVDSLKEMARRRPDNLYEKLNEVAQSGGFAKRPPRREQVEQWIEAAKELQQAKPVEE